MTQTTPPQIALVTYPGAQMSAVLGLADLLQIANDQSRVLGGDVVEVVQVDIGKLPDSPFAALVLPPSLQGVRGAGELATHLWLRRQQLGGALLCSVCAGAFWLGHAGVLNGRPATTHWALEDEFRATFPQVLLSCEALLVDDNDVVTAGGVMAWVDLGLFLVRKWLGAQVVSNTARHLLVDTGGRQQSNYRSFRPILNHGDKVILKLQLWLEGHAQAEVIQTDLAQRAGLSQRSFLRRFKQATGLTPISYLQNLRVEKARGLLERTALPVAEIGWQVGYRDASAFSRVFKQITGLSAGEYRRRFGLSMGA